MWYGWIPECHGIITLIWLFKRRRAQWQHSISSMSQRTEERASASNRVTLTGCKQTFWWGGHLPVRPGWDRRDRKPLAAAGGNGNYGELLWNGWNFLQFWRGGTLQMWELRDESGEAVERGWRICCYQTMATPCPFETLPLHYLWHEGSY